MIDVFSEEERLDLIALYLIEEAERTMPAVKEAYKLKFPEEFE